MQLPGLAVQWVVMRATDAVCTTWPGVLGSTVVHMHAVHVVTSKSLTGSGSSTVHISSLYNRLDCVCLHEQ
jgi:hypothetical protein